jgi:hypothetical protein
MSISSLHPPEQRLLFPTFHFPVNDTVNSGLTHAPDPAPAAVVNPPPGRPHADRKSG